MSSAVVARAVGFVGYQEIWISHSGVPNLGLASLCRRGRDDRKTKTRGPNAWGAFDGKGWLPWGFLFNGMLLLSLRLLRMPDFRNPDMKPEASEKADLRLKRGACSRHLSSSFLLEAHVRKRVGSCSCRIPI